MAARSYTRMIEGLNVTFTWHPKTRLWSSTIHAKRGSGTLPGGSAPSYQEAEARTRALIRRAKASN